MLHSDCECKWIPPIRELASHGSVWSDTVVITCLREQVGPVIAAIHFVILQFTSCVCVLDPQPARVQVSHLSSNCSTCVSHHMSPGGLTDVLPQQHHPENFLTRLHCCSQLCFRTQACAAQCGCTRRTLVFASFCTWPNLSLCMPRHSLVPPGTGTSSQLLVSGKVSSLPDGAPSFSSLLPSQRTRCPVCLVPRTALNPSSPSSSSILIPSFLLNLRALKYYLFSSSVSLPLSFAAGVQMDFEFSPPVSSLKSDPISRVPSHDLGHVVIFSHIDHLCLKLILQPLDQPLKFRFARVP